MLLQLLSVSEDVETSSALWDNSVRYLRNRALVECSAPLFASLAIPRTLKISSECRNNGSIVEP